MALRPEQLTALERLGERFFRGRDYTPVPFIILALLLASPTPVSLVLGGLLCAMGELVRFYGVAFIGSISRTRSYSNGALVTTGPFALLRNPLYLGNYLLVLGLAIMSAVWWMPFAITAAFYGQYIPIVAWEERKLTHIFGNSYLDYMATVPNRWFPPLLKLFDGGWWQSPTEWAPAARSERRTVTALGIMAGLMVGLWLWKERQIGFVNLVQWMGFHL